MRIAPYWARAVYPPDRPDGFVAYGWSFQSPDEARRVAAERAQWVHERVTGGDAPRAYEYAERPIREEIIERLGGDGADAAIITRNRYGALVLNTARVLFADLDFPPPRARGLLDALRLLLPGRRAARLRAVQAETRARVEQWLEQRRMRQYRLYRTRAGLRLILTNQLYDPGAAETVRLLGELQSDPLYVRLTQSQACFRARLTPKPWRCQCDKPPVIYPWRDDAEERLLRDWEATYAARASGYATCELLHQDGTPADECIAQVVTVHDQHACGGSGTAAGMIGDVWCEVDGRSDRLPVRLAHQSVVRQRHAIRQLRIHLGVSKLMCDVGEVRLTRPDAPGFDHGLVDREMGGVWRAAQAVENQHIEIAQQRARRVGDMAAVRAIRDSADTVAVHEHRPVQIRHGDDLATGQFEWPRDRAWRQLRDGAGGVGWVAKGVGEHGLHAPQRRLVRHKCPGRRP